MRRYILILSLLAAAVCWCACAGERHIQVRPAAPDPPNALDINTASEEELESLPGIGSGTARKIAVFRREHGPFRRTEQLLLVDGISENKYRAIRALIRVSPPPD